MGFLILSELDTSSENVIEFNTATFEDLLVYWVRKEDEDMDDFEELVKEDLIARSLTGYYVSSAKLVEVIQNTPEVSDETKEKVIEMLGEKIIRSKPTVDSFRLGFVMVKILDSGEIKNREEFVRILKEIRNLDKLPVVSVQGRPVD